eukprot:1569367-Rhodomonas_salina.6
MVIAGRAVTGRDRRQIELLKTIKHASAPDLQLALMSDGCQLMKKSGISFENAKSLYVIINQAVLRLGHN